jgi:predicted pyridoxine 5'-phosphate oxidase superfamily flavin-nucleotide-binding protein
MSSSPFHDGERAVQRLAGVTALADRVGPSIRRELPPAAQAFLAERRWIVIAALDAGGQPWPAIRAGAPGFVQAIDGRTLRIDAFDAPAGDPVSDDLLVPGALVGLLAIDPATRRRLRFNGRVVAHDRGGLVLEADQVFSNCPKYIQRRDDAPAADAGMPATIATAPRLTDAQLARLAAADTFFIASARPGDGVDVSHRGGMPGFLQVDGARLTWPDYGGNAMFNTLGNLHLHPQAGILVPDFERGGALIVSGRAAIDWSPGRASQLAGAERVVTLEIDRVVEQAGVLPFPLRLREYSPFNPR